MRGGENKAGLGGISKFSYSGNGIYHILLHIWIDFIKSYNNH